MREAPAMFKYNGKFYLLTSSATGWAPNENMYSVADHILGPWSPLTDPFVRTSSSDPDPKKAFNSQTASVIPVDPAKGKFIYVGDDWNGGNFSANGGAKYVWSPIEFGQGTDISIKWYGSWTTDILNKMGGVTANLKAPEVIAAGAVLDLPSQIEVTPYGSSTAAVTPVAWSVNSQPVTAATFALPGPYTLEAVLPSYNNKTIRFPIYAVPEKTIYFVNSGGQATSDYSLMTSYLQDTLLNKSVVEQVYRAADALPWGYVGTNSNPAGSAEGDIFSTLRYLNGGNVANSPAGTDLTYKFTVNNGSYTVYTGFNDIWSNATRKADLYINGVKKTAITFISNKVYAHTIDVTGGTIEVTVRNTVAQDPLINWILIVDNNLTPDPLMGLHAVSITSDSATLAWNKALGSTSYTLYRSIDADGPYAPIYRGGATSFTDTGMDPAVKYYYKVSHMGLSSESPLSDSVSVLLDQMKPVTTLNLTGAGSNGWYTSGEITLQVADDLSGVAKTEYKIGDSGDWRAYSGPFMLQDGLYTLQYRSTDRAGNAEDVQQQSFKIDQTVPGFKLSVNGREIKEGDSFEDYLPLAFQAFDNLSGLVSAQISVSDSVYNAVYKVDLTKGPSVVIDLAGKPGTHTVVVSAEDAAGNKLQQKVQIQVATSVNSINRLFERYKDRMKGPMLSQLSNSLKQAQHQLDMNRPDHAAKHMQDFVKHLNSRPLGEEMDPIVKAILLADANALITQWSGMSGSK
ncbi:Ig-like domain-containing protein [Paenibacillus sp. P26]|nr:Ig-like domain-containing protein [Paenibacillus sp. P26]